MQAILLWLLRKAVYTAAGTLLAVVVAQMQAAGSPGYDLSAVLHTGAFAGLGAALVGDLRRALAPDFLQIASGDDPRVDG